MSSAHSLAALTPRSWEPRLLLSPAADSLRPPVAKCSLRLPRSRTQICVCAFLHVLLKLFGLLFQPERWEEKAKSESLCVAETKPPRAALQAQSCRPCCSMALSPALRCSLIQQPPNPAHKQALLPPLQGNAQSAELHCDALRCGGCLLPVPKAQPSGAPGLWGQPRGPAEPYHCSQPGPMANTHCCSFPYSLSKSLSTCRKKRQKSAALWGGGQRSVCPTAAKGAHSCAPKAAPCNAAGCSPPALPAPHRSTASSPLFASGRGEILRSLSFHAVLTHI